MDAINTINDCDEYAKKEMLQQKHYFFLHEMQNMAQDIPPMFQQRLPYELLSSLANSLLDNTVFEIVRGLKELQLMTEKHLFEKRQTLVNRHNACKAEMSRDHKDILSKEKQEHPHNVSIVQDRLEQEKEVLEKTQEEEKARMDMKIIMQLDQAVSDQQVTLEKAGVPGFYVCNSPNDVKMQMYLLEFISTLCSETD